MARANEPRPHRPNIVDNSQPWHRSLALTASVARAIYEGESHALGRLRDMAGGSVTLRAVEQEFERLRYARREERVTRLFRAGRARPGLSLDAARRVLYERWLADAILQALVAVDG